MDSRSEYRIRKCERDGQLELLALPFKSTPSAHQKPSNFRAFPRPLLPTKHYLFPMSQTENQDPESGNDIGKLCAARFFPH